MESPYCADLTEASWIAKKIFPDLADVNFEIPEQGHQNFVLIHKTDVIRMARHEWAAKAMKREISILQLLGSRTPLTIPAVIDCIPEYYAMRTTRVPGKPLSPETLNGLPQDQQQNIAERLAEFIAFMHEDVVLSDEQRIFFRGDTAYFHGQISSLITERINKVSSKKHLETAKQYIDHYDTINDDIVLTHGDLMGGNILYDDRTGKIGVVDFTGTSTGYRHVEFKKLLTYSASFYDAVTASYKERTGYNVDRDLVRTAYSLNEIYNTRHEQPSRSRFKLHEAPTKP